MGQMKLFDEDYNEDVSRIEINKEYAKRFEHNKKREELQRYEELKKKGVIEDDDSDDESSESEEDDGDIMGNSKKDLEFINALLLVKKQDPSIKEKDVRLFDSESDGNEGEDEEEEEEEGEKSSKKEKEKKKAMYLKDVMAKHLIEQGPEFQDEKEEEMGEKEKKKKSYSEEQEEIRKAFLDAVKEAERNGEEDDGLLKEKKKGDNDEEDVEDADNDKFVEKLDDYFGGDGELDENKKFLKEFFKNKMWIDKEKKDEEVDDEEVEDLLREDEELERQELYETNYRHEEGVEDRIMGHSRKVEGSVRKKDNVRKEQRKSKEERMKIAEMERKEELKHLKNLKKKEMKERMKKVMAIAGFKDDEELPFNLRDLDDEFDPKEYDKMMKAVFDEKYYGAEDVDPEFGHDREDDEGDLEKPDCDKEDELLGLPKGWDVIESGDGFNAARARSLKHKLEHDGEDEEDDDDEEEVSGSENDDGEEEMSGSEEDGDKREEIEGEGEREEQEKFYEESKRKRKRKMSLVKRAKEEMLEEFYKLDYEDTIGDLKTRFRYAKVKPNKYGLKTEEILMMDDKDLNQYVSVKKLASYREKEWKVPKSKIHQQKLKNKEFVLGRKSDRWKAGNKEKKMKIDADRSASEIGLKGDENSRHEDEPNADAGTLSKRAKTRRRQAKPKLSHSRLIAYGKISSKAKSKH